MSEKITAADAIRMLDAHEAAAVDVREPDEFAVGHIPGAKLLPLGQVLSRAAEVINQYIDSVTLEQLSSQLPASDKKEGCCSCGTKNA